MYALTQISQSNMKILNIFIQPTGVVTYCYSFWKHSEWNWCNTNISIYIFIRIRERERERKLIQSQLLPLFVLI